MRTRTPAQKAERKFMRFKTQVIKRLQAMPEDHRTYVLALIGQAYGYGPKPSNDGMQTNAELRAIKRKALMARRAA